jgi:hypothetical protein
MPSPLVSYLASRPDTATFLIPADVPRAVEELFPRIDILPQPYRIFPADETVTPTLGFPVAESPVIKELDLRLDRWLGDEVVWQIDRNNATAKDRAQSSFAAYLGHLMKTVENALMSSVLNDYHAVFWLAHSFDLARQFCALPRRVSAADTQIGRTQGDTLKYRILSRWITETREAMTQLTVKASPILDGEEQRAAQFVRLLQDDVLIFTEEFISPDLRELRSFITGYLRRDFQAFRDSAERLRESAVDLLMRDRTFRAALPLFGVTADQGISIALLLDTRFQQFLFEQTNVQNVTTREDREQFQLIARRVREFSVLNQLRRGIVWMTAADGKIVSTDRRNGMVFSHSTRPMDFGRQGVVDPMVHRFGLIYDISKFSETLGNIRRGGRREEVSSYRQMVLFQRRMEIIARRHKLQFEKFLGDGAFYTTRRALSLVRAAVEIQRFYSEMKRKGFAFNKGLRIALNYGYYRLLPMKTSNDSNERITEFYGPGIVELSRLTTGKATKEIDELAAFLIAHGYSATQVQQFFAPLAKGVDVVDHSQHAREFHAYVNSSGHLINEGIVASLAMIQELSAELVAESQQLYRLRAPWGSYIGFPPVIGGLEYIGVRLLGMVSLKGLDDIDVGEIVSFAPGEAEAVPLDTTETLVTVLRQEFHQEREADAFVPSAEPERDDTTHERLIEPELMICVNPDPVGSEEDVLIGLWDPHTDGLHRPLKMPRDDFQRLFSLQGGLTADLLDEKKQTVRDLYNRLSDRSDSDTLALGRYREAEYETYLIGAVVEKL